MVKCKNSLNYIQCQKFETNITALDLIIHRLTDQERKVLDIVRNSKERIISKHDYWLEMIRRKYDPDYYYKARLEELISSHNNKIDELVMTKSFNKLILEERLLNDEF